MAQHYLTSDGINEYCSESIIEATQKMVAEIFRYNKDQPYRTYVCLGFIRNEDIATAQDIILFRQDDAETVVEKHCSQKLKDFSSIQVSNAIISDFQYTHVLLERKIFETGLHEVRIVTNPEHLHLGYYSNSRVLSPEGLAYLRTCHKAAPEQLC